MVCLKSPFLDKEFGFSTRADLLSRGWRFLSIFFAEWAKEKPLDEVDSKQFLSWQVCNALTHYSDFI